MKSIKRFLAKLTMLFISSISFRTLPVLIVMVFLTSPLYASKIDLASLQIGLGQGNTSGTYRDDDLSANLKGKSQNLFHFLNFYESEFSFLSGISISNLSGETTTAKSKIEFDYKVTFLELSYGYAFEAGFFQTHPSIMFGMGKSSFDYKVVTVQNTQMKSSPRNGSPSKIFVFLPLYFYLTDHFFIGFHGSGGTTIDKFDAGSSKASVEIKNSMNFVMGGGF